MAHVTYIRPLSKVGFRLLGATHPQHAAALSGITPNVWRGALGALGDDSTDLANAGFDQTQVAEIMWKHQDGSLSDAGYQQLVSGTIDPANLSAFLDADPGAPETGGGTPAAGGGAAVLPTGTLLIYQATVNNHVFTGNIGAFLSALSGMMPAIGLQTVSSQVVQSQLLTTTIQLGVQITGGGYGKPADVQAQIDHAIWTQRGEMPMSSSIAVTNALTPAQQQANQPGSTAGLTQFLEQNMVTILLALGAIAVLPSLVKKL